MTFDRSAARAALDECFRSNQALVHGLVFDRCGDIAIAEEITAQTFEAAARRFSSGNGHEVTPGWLTVVARRRLIDYWRHASAATRAAQRVAYEGQTAASSEMSVDARVSNALDSLSERQRAALTLRYIDDLPVSEIADVLGLTYLAAESLLARSRRAMREIMNAADKPSSGEEDSA